jgi:hypothetical protein
MNRRLFCRSLGIVLATLGVATGAADAAPPTLERLAQVLGLEGAEVAWLNDLSDRERSALLAALTSRTRPSRATVDLLYRVLGRRERLFQYVGYPPLPNRLTACDGLIRE